MSLGIAYALTIWLVNYAGVAPSLGILPPISRDQPGRPTVIAAGHLVYGIALVCAMNHLAVGRQGNERAR